MSILDPSQLLAMAAACVQAMPDTVTVLRATDTTDALGSSSKTWAPVGSWPCRVGARSQRHAGGDEPVLAGKVSSVTPYKMTVPATATITAADRLQVGERTFEAIRVADATSWAIETVIWCEEVA